MKKLSLLLIWLPFFAVGQVVDTVAVCHEVDSLIRISLGHINSRDFKEALKVNNFAKSITLQNLGKQSAVYGIIVFNHGKIVEAKGNYSEAERLFLTGLDNQERAMPGRPAEFADNLIHLGKFYFGTSKQEKVEPLYSKALQIMEKMLSREHPGYASTLHLLADFFFMTGQSEKAEDYYLKVLDLRQKNYGDQHPEYASVLNDLAICYWKTGRFEEAEPLLYQALDIIEQKPGKTTPSYAWTLLNLGGYYVKSGHADQAVSLYREAVLILEKTFGKQNAGYAWGLDGLGRCYFQLGEYGKAEKIYLEVKHIRETLLGKKHNDYAVSLRRFCTLYSKTQQHEKAAAYYAQASRLNLEHMQKGTKFLSEAELTGYLSTFTLAYHELLTYLNNNWASAPVLHSIAFDNTLFHKGFILENSQRLKAIIASLPDSIQYTYELWQSAHRLLAKEYTRPISQRKNLEVLETKVNLLEKELARAVAGFDEAIRQIEWEEVQAALQPGETVVEFVHYIFSDPTPTDSIMYAALILREGDKQPFFVPLFESKELENLLQVQPIDKKAYLNQLYHNDNENEPFFNTLYQMIWKPLDSFLFDTKTIYASPSGLLHRINLGAIMVDSNHSFADKFYLAPLGSTRQLAADSRAPSAFNRRPNFLSAAIYGGIHYDMDSTAIRNANDDYRKKKRNWRRIDLC